jgi:outer membrane protein
MIQKSIFFLLTLLVVATGTVSAQKIGYLNTNELLIQMPEVKSADSILSRYRDDIQKVYASYVMEYQQKLADYQNNFESWSEVMREAAEEDLGKLQIRISEYEQQSADKLEQKKQELYDPILEKVRAAIKLVGEENKFTAILDNVSLLYVGADAVDILPLVKKKLGL